MSALIEDKTASGTGNFVVSCFVFHCFSSKFRFYFVLAFTLLAGTQRIFISWQLLLFLLFFCCVNVFYRKKKFIVRFRWYISPGIRKRYPRYHRDLTHSLYYRCYSRNFSEIQHSHEVGSAEIGLIIKLHLYMSEFVSGWNW